MNRLKRFWYLIILNQCPRHCRCWDYEYTVNANGDNSILMCTKCRRMDNGG